MDKASRYLATVRRATLMPFSSSIFASLLSLNGFALFSSSISFLIIARMAVAEHTPPSEVLTWLREEIFELKNTTWRVHIFVCCNARDRLIREALALLQCRATLTVSLPRGHSQETYVDAQ